MTESKRIQTRTKYPNWVTARRHIVRNLLQRLILSSHSRLHEQECERVQESARVRESKKWTSSWYFTLNTMKCPSQWQPFNGLVLYISVYISIVFLGIFFFSYCCCMGDRAVIVIPTANICRMDIIKCRLCGIFYVADPIKFIQI